MDRPALVLEGTDGDDPSVTTLADQIEHKPGQGEVAEMICRELGFEALAGKDTGREHHPGVVDEHVDPLAAGDEGVREAPD